jgi:hypothetical protein
MPYHIDFDSTNKILRGRFDDCVTDEILEEFYRVATEYVARMDPRSGLTDFSDVTSFTVSAQSVRKLARSEPAMPDSSRIRVVVAPPDHIYGIARLFQLAGEHTRPNLHVVRTLKEAWAILGVQKPRFEQIKIE